MYVTHRKSSRSHGKGKTKREEEIIKYGALFYKIQLGRKGGGSQIIE
jgi:hypothetical protein